MSEQITAHYLANSIATLREYKQLAEKAVAQVSDEEFFAALDAESNSIAVIMKHIAGNMISRWTDFLTSDGEKPDRNRDAEFEMTPHTTRAEIAAYWERGWAAVFTAVEPLTVEDFDRKTLIRGEPHTIVQAINRQLTHYAYHIGQIVFLAKHFRSAEWQSLSVPRNRSSEFNQSMAEKHGRS
jgi:hypothetical protein